MVVEDEEDIVRLITFHLTKEGYRVISAGNGLSALELAAAEKPDLYILDIMLPGLDGLEVCRRLRSFPVTAAAPVIFLSARNEEMDKVLGLELGADDYMVKPFSVRELIARVRAMLRRLDNLPLNQELTPSKHLSKSISVGPVKLDPEKHRVTVNGKEIALTHKEFLLLQLLMDNAGRVLTRELLLDRVWGYEVEVDTRTVDVHIRYLRQKIEQDPSSPHLIETVRGVGYRFNDFIQVT